MHTRPHPPFDAKTIDLAFYSNAQSSIPAKVYNFCCKIAVETNENKQKRGRVGPFYFYVKVVVEQLSSNPIGFVYFPSST